MSMSTTPPHSTRAEANDQLERGMRVTFDTDELAAFYDGFDSLESMTHELFVACGLIEDEQPLARVA